MSSVPSFQRKREVLENGVHALDGRIMYGSCISHLPVGPVYHDNKNEFVGVYRKDGKLSPKSGCPGFYNVTTRVPEDHNHIGLIKSGISRSPRDDRGYYPNEPGTVITNWVSAAEVALLINDGWPVQINGRIIWPETEKITDPLAVWKRHLLDFRSEIEQELKNNPGDKILELHKAMVRDMVIKAGGKFHQYMTYDDRTVPRSELPLEDTPYRREILRRNAKEIEVREWRPLSERRQKWIHPEWSATMWGRARAKLAEFALRLPYEDVVNLRVDCVLSSSKPEWLESEDTGKPGCFREKAHIETPWPWPKDINEVNAYLV